MPAVPRSVAARHLLGPGGRALRLPEAEEANAEATAAADQRGAGRRGLLGNNGNTRARSVESLGAPPGACRLDSLCS